MQVWGKNQILFQSKKGGSKQIFDNCRPTSSLSICRKTLERILFNSPYEFLEQNNLLCEHQSGFRPLDSCEYHFLSIMHRIYLSFDCWNKLYASQINKKLFGK